MKPRNLLTILLVMLLGLGIAACSVRGGDQQGDKAEDGAESDGKKGEKKDKKEEAVPVEVIDIGRGAIEAVLRSSTNLEAESSVKVFSEASRRVVALLAEEGQTVRRGQLLLRLQDDEQRSALAKAQSQLEKAEREYARKSRLHQQQMIPDQEYNDATFDLEQKKIALEDAKRELGYTEVRAPIAGVVTQRLVNLGDTVSVNQHLFDLVDFDSLVARIYVPEKHLRELAVGQAARLTAPSLGDAGFEGKVLRISPIVDPQSGTVKVTVGVGRQAGLRPGLYVDVDVVTATNESALLVPKRALVYDQDRIFVYRLGDERRVERVPVVPVLSDKEYVQPLEGFADGDRVVVAGQAGLKNGALVRLPGDPDEAAEEEEEGADA